MAWALANSNLALVKYWGKAPGGTNHPAGASLSVTLEGLSSAAQVVFDPELDRDRFEGMGSPEAVASFLEQARGELGVRAKARVRLASNFPVAAGLASSASSFAALAVASAAACGARLSAAELGSLARRGSGSACRSLFGGFVEWIPREGGSEVVPLAPQDHWRLSILVAITSEERKRVGSREGMTRTAATSPYYRAWLDAGCADLDPVREAIRRRDLTRLGEHVEQNCLRMHGAAMAADPPLLYWEPATLAVIREVWNLRARGIEAYFSIDAGPQVKVLCEPASESAVESAIGGVPGVRRVLRSRPGGAPKVIDAPPPWTGTGSAARPETACDRRASQKAW